MTTWDGFRRWVSVPLLYDVFGAPLQLVKGVKLEIGYHGLVGTTSQVR